MKKKFSLFYRIYFLFLVVFVVLLVIFSFFLAGYINQYNQGIAETVSQRFFEDIFVELDVDKIIEMSSIEPCEFETKRDIERFISEQLSGELTYTNISANTDDDTKKYIVKSGNYKLATFTLMPDENDDYSPISLELHLPRSYQKTYKVLSGSELKINGVTVTEKYITERIPHENARYLPEGVTKPEWITYTVNGLTKEPEAIVTDRNGNLPELIEIDGVLCEQIIYDENSSEITERLLTAAKQYAKCMQNDAKKSAVLAYYKKDTELYQSIRTVENMFVWDHDGYDFKNETVSEFMRYDENTVSLRISFTHILMMNGKPDYRDITDITFFAENIDGEYMIFAQYNN